MTKLEVMAAKQGQAADALRLLLEAMSDEALMVTKGQAEAEAFVGRLSAYMGALHFIADTLEDMAELMGNEDQA